MTLPFSVHNSAELELNEAADFYDIENPSLGRALIDEFEGAVATIREHPETAPIVLGNVRRWRMLRFPYFLVYSAILLAGLSLRVGLTKGSNRRQQGWRVSDEPMAAAYP